MFFRYSSTTHELPGENSLTHCWTPGSLPVPTWRGQVRWVRFTIHPLDFCFWLSAHSVDYYFSSLCCRRRKSFHSRLAIEHRLFLEVRFLRLSNFFVLGGVTHSSSGPDSIVDQVLVRRFAPQRWVLRATRRVLSLTVFFCAEIIHNKLLSTSMTAGERSKNFYKEPSFGAATNRPISSKTFFIHQNLYFHPKKR